MTDKEVMQMALDALLESKPIDMRDAEAFERSILAMQALTAALEQPEPKKLLVIRGQKDKVVAIYRENDEDIARAELPNKKLVGLTDEEILEEYRQSYGDDGNLTDVYFARAIEQALKEKNT